MAGRRAGPEAWSRCSDDHRDRHDHDDGGDVDPHGGDQE
jgi:hypothetical protein